MKLNLASVVLIVVGCLVLVGGVGWIFEPAGAILAGILALAAGILLLERGGDAG